MYGSCLPKARLRPVQYLLSHAGTIRMAEKEYAFCSQPVRDRRSARGHTDEIAVRGITRPSVASRIRRNQKQTMLARRGPPHLQERKAIAACTVQKDDDCPGRRVCGSELVPTAPERPKTGFMLSSRSDNRAGR